ncbi:MAG: cupin domain-containing protein [Deltaproteobacteria bacterium]|nr:cupin domain-containing protein [Deltaproteobacteria bacterium]
MRPIGLALLVLVLLLGCSGPYRHVVHEHRRERPPPVRVPGTGVIPLVGAPPDAPVELTLVTFPTGRREFQLPTDHGHEVIFLSFSSFSVGTHDLRSGDAVRLPRDTPAMTVRPTASSPRARAVLVRVRCTTDTPCAAGDPQVVSITAVPDRVIDGWDARVRVLFPTTPHDQTAASLARISMALTGREMRIPPHLHETSAEMLLVINGNGTMHVGDQAVALRPWVAIYVPPNTPHHLDGSTDAPYLWQVFVPPEPETADQPASSPR